MVEIGSFFRNFLSSGKKDPADSLLPAHTGQQNKDIPLEHKGPHAPPVTYPKLVAPDQYDAYMRQTVISKNHIPDELEIETRDSIKTWKKTYSERIETLPVSNDLDLTALLITPEFKTSPKGAFGVKRDTGIHYGIDIPEPVKYKKIKGKKIKMDTPIRTPGDAIVVHVGRDKHAGNFVVFACKNRNGELIYFRCLHLKKKPKGLRPGMIIKKGTEIGQVGNTGRSRGAHLHLEVLHEVKGEPNKMFSVNILSLPIQEQLALRKAPEYIATIPAPDEQGKEKGPKTKYKPTHAYNERTPRLKQDVNRIV